MNKISAFVICRNEETVLGRALESLVHFADEIIVVDNESTDHTQEVAHRYTPQVFTHPWSKEQSFAALRNFAVSKCQHPWIFYLDADEFCSAELIHWLKSFKNQETDHAPDDALFSRSQHPRGIPKTAQIDMYEIRRVEHFMGQAYYFGSGNPSHQWRFFRRGLEFTGLVHEYPVFDGEIRRVECPIMHYPKSTPEDVFVKLNKYTSLEAQALFEQGVVREASYMFFSGLAMFLKAYFRKEGCRDGGVGLFLAITDGVSFFLRQAKLYFLNKRAGKI